VAPDTARAQATGHSNAANAVARYFVEHSPNALFGDVQSSVAELAKHTGLTENDTKDALHELGTLLTHFHVESVTATDELYVRFDSFWMPWVPGEDALKLAADLVNDQSFPHVPREIAAQYEWLPRRLNPAIAYLFNRKLVRGLKAMDGMPFVVHLLHPDDSTRRFLTRRA
jgi:hypothetical protein